MLLALLSVFLQGALGATYGEDCGTDIFIRNDFIELGLNSHGAFGSTDCVPTGPFFTNRMGSWKIGMLGDYDGFESGADYRIDFFQPGSPEEAMQYGYSVGGSVVTGYTVYSGENNLVVTSQTLGSGASATSVLTTTDGNMRFTITYTIPDGQQYFDTEVVAENIGGSTLENVRYGRSFDPDNTVDYGGSYTTVNTIEQQIATGESSQAIVSANTIDGDSYAAALGKPALIFMRSSYSSAVVYTQGFGIRNVYSDVPSTPQNVGYQVTSDTAIGIYFELGSMAAGTSTTFSYKTLLTAGDVDEVIEEVGGDEDCAGDWSDCTAACELGVERTWIQTLAPAGEGAACPTVAPDCEGGEDACPECTEGFTVTSTESFSRCAKSLRTAGWGNLGVTATAEECGAACMADDDCGSAAGWNTRNGKCTGFVDCSITEESTDTFTCMDVVQCATDYDKMCAARDGVEPVDCSAMTTPMNVVKTSETSTEITYLDMSDGAFKTLFEVPDNECESINGCGVSPIDNKIYCHCKETDGSSCLIRFDDCNVEVVVDTMAYSFSSAFHVATGDMYYMADSKMYKISGLGTDSISEEMLYDTAAARKHGSPSYNPSDIVILDVNIQDVTAPWACGMRGANEIFLFPLSSDCYGHDRCDTMIYATGEMGPSNGDYGAAYMFNNEAYFADNAAQGLFRLDFTPITGELPLAVMTHVAGSTSSNRIDGLNCPVDSPF